MAMLNLVRKEIDGQQLFDIEFLTSEEQSDAAQAAAATLIYVALFTDARASDGLIGSRVVDSARGWWADPFAGSGLWHVRRQALGSAARDEAVSEVQRALDAYAPTMTDIEVRDVSGGSVSVVALEVTGKHNGHAFSVGLTL